MAVASPAPFPPPGWNRRSTRPASKAPPLAGQAPRGAAPPARLLAALGLSAALHFALFSLVPWSAGSGGGERGTPTLTVTLRAGEATMTLVPVAAEAGLPTPPVARADIVPPTGAVPAPVAAAPAPTGPGRFLREGEFDVPPRPLEDITPVYPDAAVDLRLRGRVELEVRVDRDGRVVEARVLSARPVEIFDASALRAVRQARFAPAKVRGEPVGSVLRAIIEYEAP
ncbi:MAG: energy transducer TonB [Rhodocyclaceae bacterium]|nr:energy transducer TonB [Rhodocyclaceae bacterium]